MTEPRVTYSLRRRLTFAIVAGFLVIIAGLALAVWVYARNAADRTYDLLLDGSSIAILERVSQTQDGIAVDFPPSALEILGLARQDRVFYRVFDAAGATITGRGTLPLSAGFAAGTGPGSGAGSGPVSGPVFFDGVVGGEAVRFVVTGRNLAGPSGSQWVGVQVGQTRAARRGVQLEVFWHGMTGLVLLAGIGILFAHLGINLAMKPLAGIGNEIARRDPSDLAPLKAAPPREVEALIQSFNGFMRRLDQNKENAQGFIADVAHQVRTSLTTLKGQIDMAEDQTDPDDMRARLGKASAQANRTIHLTNQLLSHAMVIHRSDETALVEVDAVSVARGVLEQVLRDRRSRNVDFEFRGADRTGATLIRADEVSLSEALRNLIDNAARFAGTPPRVALEIAPGSIDTRPALAFVVEDNGRGIAPDQYDRVTERFVTLGDDGGSGLGLAIVAAVARAHGGTLTLDRGSLGGLRAKLALPLEGGAT